MQGLAISHAFGRGKGVKSVFMSEAKDHASQNSHCDCEIVTET